MTKQAEGELLAEVKALKQCMPGEDTVCDVCELVEVKLDQIIDRYEHTGEVDTNEEKLPDESH